MLNQYITAALPVFVRPALDGIKSRSYSTPRLNMALPPTIFQEVEPNEGRVLVLLRPISNNGAVTWSR